MSKNYDDNVRSVEGKRVDESRVIKGVRYSSLEHGVRVLVRVARQDYPDADIRKGDPYIEILGSGAYNSGDRINIERAVREGWAVVGEKDIVRR